MKISSKLNQVILTSILSVAIVVGCVAAIPIAVHYSSTDDKYVAVAEVRKDADELWLAVVRAAEKREGESEGEMKILKKDSTARLLEATDGVQTASIGVIPTGERTVGGHRRKTRCLFHEPYADRTSKIHSRCRRKNAAEINVLLSEDLYRTGHKQTLKR